MFFCRAQCISDSESFIRESLNYVLGLVRHLKVLVPANLLLSPIMPLTLARFSSDGGGSELGSLKVTDA